MIPYDDGYLPMFREDEAFEVDWFRPGSCGLFVSRELWPEFQEKCGWPVGIVTTDYSRLGYVVLPKPLHFLFRWIPLYHRWGGERYASFLWSFGCPKWDLWYARPGCFGLRWGDSLFGLKRISREIWDEKLNSMSTSKPVPYPRWGIVK